MTKQMLTLRSRVEIMFRIQIVQGWCALGKLVGNLDCPAFPQLSGNFLFIIYCDLLGIANHLQTIKELCLIL